MGQDIILTRTLLGEHSNLLVDLLVIPIGENRALQQLDISGAAVSTAFSDHPELGDRASGATVGDVLQRIGRRAGTAGASDLVELARLPYLPLPMSPEIAGLALSDLAQESAIELLAGGEIVGFVTQPDGLIALAVIYLVGEPLAQTIRAAVRRAGDYALVAADRKMANAFGFQLEPHGGFPSQRQPADAPKFDFRPAGVTRTLTAFQPQIDVVHIGGAALDRVRFRFCGKRVRSDDSGADWDVASMSRRISDDTLARTHGMFDLSREPDPGVEWPQDDDELGLEVRYEVDGEAWRVRAAWPLIRTGPPGKPLLDLGVRSDLEYARVPD